jgi:hypothetical protein
MVIAWSVWDESEMFLREEVGRKEVYLCVAEASSE